VCGTQQNYFINCITKQSKGRKQMNKYDELWAKANAAFYEWEEENGFSGLSDDTRIMFCYGYIIAMEEKAND
jgi:hypothetical protein